VASAMQSGEEASRTKSINEVASLFSKFEE
jgi:hypothetical protein